MNVAPFALSPETCNPPVKGKYKRFTKPKPQKRGKPVVYDKEAIIRPLKQIWLVNSQSSLFQKTKSYYSYVAA